VAFAAGILVTLLAIIDEIPVFENNVLEVLHLSSIRRSRLCTRTYLFEYPDAAISSSSFVAKIPPTGKVASETAPCLMAGARSDDCLSRFGGSNVALRTLPLLNLGGAHTIAGILLTSSTRGVRVDDQ
jgi:hypothetical protein